MRHYYGALCMASNAKGNYCQFYIVNNNTKVNIDEVAEKVKTDLNDPEISAGLLESDKEYYNEYYKRLSDMPDEVKERYAQVGGIYDLDGTDTVFGQVVDGWDVLVALNGVETVAGNVTDDRSSIFSKPLDEIVIEKIVVIHITPAETTTSEEGKATRPSRTTPADSTSEPASPGGIIIDDLETVTTPEETTTAEAQEDEPVESGEGEEGSEGGEPDENGEADESSEAGENGEEG